MSIRYDAAAMSTPGTSDSLVGRTIAHYAITGRLGEGGMGAVYLARDVRLNRDVAVKVIAPAAGSDPALSHRLLREARAASALNHPNIVTIHEIAEADGLDFIVMERVEGRSLASLISPGGMPIEQVLDFGSQIADAVAAAHGAHIVHRDLKPANVMVTPAGRLKVLDFGLARFAAPRVLDESATTAAMSVQLTGSRAILGSVGYMSPEQIEGKAAHEPSDVFALGVILFQMLTGRRPFIGDTDWSVLAATVQGTSPPVQSLRPDVPGDLARIVARCLERRPEDRYPSAAGVADDLRRLAAPYVMAARGRRSPKLVLVGVVLVAIAVAVPTGLLVRESRARWARGQALVEVEKRRAAGDLVGAYATARSALAIVPADLQVREAWDHLVLHIDVESQPPGAEVAIHSYVGGDRWLPLGRTPLKDVSVPFGLLSWRFARSGYDTLLVGQGHDIMEFTLARSGAAPTGMVLVPSGSVQVESTGQPVDLPEFWLDRCEVTNRQYKAFVDAGGYRRRELWKGPFIRDGRTVSFEEAMAAFHDTTGRPGPATWEFGSYPAGQDEYPVTGVSWYEAAAYAAYAGRQLPTVFHWYRASGSQGVFSEIVTQSNFSAKGPARVASMGGLGPFGTYDMAGNAKEWCWNAEDGRRYILGGGWNELAYAFHDEDARLPFEREGSFGFRCMLQRDPLAANLTAPLRAFERDPASLVPVGDELFHAYRRLYDYDSTPLDVRLESKDDKNPAWREEVVTVRAPYGGERLPIHVYVPKSGSPPYQVVVFFPGSNAVRTSSSASLSLRMSDFHIRAGRVLVYPIYQGTYERRTPGRKGRNELRDIMIQRGKDIRRTVDYLAARGDIDTTRIAFYGVSLGAQLGPLFLAIEPRLRTGVLFAGGFETWDMPPEGDPVNFTPRVKVPVIMVNGREDFDLPFESAQLPMFRMLGTPEGQKRHVVLTGGHIPLNPDAAIRAMSEWLDTRFGAPR